MSEAENFTFYSVGQKMAELCDDALDALRDVIEEAKPLGDSTVSPWSFSHHEKIEQMARDLRHEIMVAEGAADKEHNA